MTRTSLKTLRNYTFSIDIFNDYVLVRDPRRNYAQIARVALPEGFDRQSSRKLDDLFTAVHRAIIQHYSDQHRGKILGIEFLPGAQLSKEELDAGVGLLNESLSHRLEPKLPPEPTPVERALKRRKRR